MSNLFDKQRFLNDLINCSESIGRKSLMVLIEVLKNQPAIEAEPVVHGRWIFGNANHREYMKCSECLHSQTPTGVFVYCPNCGAKMIGGIDHDSGKSN